MLAHCLITGIFLPGNHVSNPATPLRVVECGEGNTSQAASLPCMIYGLTFSVFPKQDSSYCLQTYKIRFCMNTN